MDARSAARCIPAKLAALSDAVDSLYGLPLGEFIAERDALAKRLRKEGDRDAAAAVKAVRKPSVAAWAVNQVVRADPEALSELLAAGEALREGGGGRALRDAVARERAAVEELVAAAAELESEDGSRLSAATLDKVRTTLRAAGSDDEVRAEVAAGRVTRERESVGLGAWGLGAEPVAAANEPVKEAAAERPAAKDRAAADERAAAEARAAAKQRERERAARRTELAAAVRVAKAEAGRRGIALSTAERAAEAARGAFEEAERRLEKALGELRQRKAAAAEAEQKLEEAERCLQEVDDED